MQNREELEKSFDLVTQQLKEHLKIIQVYESRANALRDAQFYYDHKLKDLKIYETIFKNLKDV